MGITVHYRGIMKNLDRIEDFEDRVLDLALELGGQAHIWRTSCDTSPSRLVRGVILDLCPGQETTSLLLSPEGWLIGLVNIEDAAGGRLAEPPWCFVKTQFGTLEGHVALVEMFRALKAEFFPGLEVNDESGYWGNGDLKELAKKRVFLQSAVKLLGEGLEKFGLTAEAAEDPNIVVSRIERIAWLVQDTLRRPSEHPIVRWKDEDIAVDFTGRLTPEEEARWDASFKENRRRQERVQRTIEKHLFEGESIEEAIDATMREETALGLPADEYEDEEDGEDWRDSLPDELEYVDSDEDWSTESDEADAADDPFDLAQRERHPLLERASDLLLRLHDLLKKEPQTRSGVGTLMQGAMEISGGLAQATSFADDDYLGRGLAVVQLKRSLRGAAFAIGALFPLRADGLIDEAIFKELHAALAALQNDIFNELRRRREGKRDRHV